MLHTVGIEARGDFRPQLDADIFTTWNAAGAELRAVLKREGGQIILRIEHATPSGSMITDEQHPQRSPSTDDIIRVALHYFGLS